MSARKLDSAPVAVGTRNAQCLNLSSDAVRIRKNGIEFRNPEPLAQWTEMTVRLQGPNPAREVKFNAVVVACNRAQPQGYAVSMLFTQMTRLSQARLLGYS